MRLNGGNFNVQWLQFMALFITLRWKAKLPAIGTDQPRATHAQAAHAPQNRQQVWDFHSPSGFINAAIPDKLKTFFNRIFVLILKQTSHVILREKGKRVYMSYGGNICSCQK